VVLNASTTASVNKEKGGSKAVLYKDTLTSWLKEKNPSGTQSHTRTHDTQHARTHTHNTHDDDDDN
jgi:hypothetical protein